MPFVTMEETIALIKKSKETQVELATNKEIIDTLKKEAEEFKSTDTAVLLYQRKYDESQEKVTT